MPWQQHVVSRHAAWGGRLVRALADGLTQASPVWHSVANAILLRSATRIRSAQMPQPQPQHAVTASGRPANQELQIQPFVHPALALLTASADEFRVAAGCPVLPHGPLRRIVLAFKALTATSTPLGDVSPVPLVPGAWCATAPLWGNPLLPSPLLPGEEGGGGPGSCLEHAFGDLQVIPSLRTVGDACRIAQNMSAAMQSCSASLLQGEVASRFCHVHVWEPELARVGVQRMPSDMLARVGDRGAVWQRFLQLQACVPSAWLEQCSTASAVDIANASASAVPLLVARLGWRLPVPPGAAAGTVGSPVFLPRLAVKTGTHLQMRPHSVERQTRHAAFVALAMEQSPLYSPPPELLTSFARTLSSLWRLKWENLEKEVLWRLAVDGIAGANAYVQPRFCCRCCPEAGPLVPRAHCFWDCPVAIAVRQAIAAALLPATPVVSRASIWLCRPPPGVHIGVWRVVCLAALSAMEHGRRKLWGFGVETDQAAAVSAAARQRTLEDVWGLPAPAAAPCPIARASNRAVTDFWGRLTSFATLRLAPASWLGQVGINHPFLCSGGVQVRMGPAAAAAEAALPVVAALPNVRAPRVVTFRQRPLEELWHRRSQPAAAPHVGGGVAGPLLSSAG